MTNDNNNTAMDYDTLVNAGALGNGAYIVDNDVYFVTSYKGEDYAEGWEQTEGNWFNVATGTLAEDKTLRLISHTRELRSIHEEEIQAGIEYKGLSRAAAILRANAAHNGIVRTMENGNIFIDIDFIVITD